MRINAVKRSKYRSSEPWFCGRNCSDRSTIYEL